MLLMTLHFLSSGFSGIGTIGFNIYLHFPDSILGQCIATYRGCSVAVLSLSPHLIGGLQYCRLDYVKMIFVEDNISSVQASAVATMSLYVGVRCADYIYIYIMDNMSIHIIQLMCNATYTSCSMQHISGFVVGIHSDHYRDN